MTPKLKYNIKLYACLLAGGVLLVFSNLNQAIPLAAWLFPVFIMRYMRRQRSVPGMIAGGIVVVGATFLLYYKVMAGLPPLLMILLIGSSGIFCFAVFFADKLIARRLTGILSTLVFPCLWTAVEYLKSFIPGGATFGSLAYSQYGDLPLMQLVSLTGIWGLTFLISWFAPVANFMWEKKVEWLKIRSVAGAFAAVFAAVMVFGGARLALFPPAGEYVRTAGITSTGTNAGFVSVYRDRVFPPLEEYRQRLTALSGRAAAGGARVIVWQEYGFFIAEENERAFVDFCAGLAKREQVYLSVGAAVYDNKAKMRGRNTTFLIDPSGTLLWKYVKHNLVQGLETRNMQPGPPVLPSARTPYGKFTGAVCYDHDFPGYILQAGRNGTDIMLSPYLEWEEITPFHAYMSVFRAIENGFSMIRPAGDGLSLAVDYQGRVLAAKNEALTNQRIMFADLPLKGVRTVYAFIGDSFAWLCILGFLALGTAAVIRGIIRRAA